MVQGGRAGLRFESNLSVAEWLPGGRAMAPQQRVDELVQQVRASGTVHTDPSASPPRFQSGKLTALELTRLTVALESLAEDLAADPEVVKRHLKRSTWLLRH